MCTTANDEPREKTKRKILGNDCQGRATYTPMMQASGFLYGETVGVFDTSYQRSLSPRRKEAGIVRLKRLWSCRQLAQGSNPFAFLIEHRIDYVEKGS